MSVRDQLLRTLADGRFHSGEDLARAAGLSRTAVWKQVRRLGQDLGLVVSAVRGRGYRLDAALELLDAERICAEIDGQARDRLDALHLLSSVASTNTCAKDDPPMASGRARAWLAEHQTAGRGRRGRGWVSAFGDNVYLSLAWRFDLPMAALAGLSLAAGVAVAEALAQIGVDGHALKWPNDVLLDRRKLGGVLVEVAGESEGPASAVIGVGVNVCMPQSLGARIDQPWTDLQRGAGLLVSRNQLAGMLLNRLIRSCDQFASEGLAPFVAPWRRFDRLCGEGVRLINGDHVLEGIYRGITPTGALLLEGPRGPVEYQAGEVSLRRMEDA